jgi:hypothetical protein
VRTAHQTKHHDAEKVTIGLVFKRARVTIDVHVRPAILARHRAMAAAMGHDMGAYFDESIAHERIEDALDYIVSPYFGSFTKVEFAQELIATAWGAGPELPWDDDPFDWGEDGFKAIMENWASVLEEREREVFAAVTSAALEGDGARVRELVVPYVETQIALATADDASEAGREVSP